VSEPEANSSSSGRAAAVHFPGLNGMRFWAAVAIIAFHIEIFKQVGGIPSWGQIRLWKWMGPYSLVSFFAMSGFLIIYLLVEEQRRTGKVDARKFQLRRILRIWPLYYTVTLLGIACMALFPGQDRLPDSLGEATPQWMILYVFLMPNIAFAVYGIVPYIGPLWSIGVEQHFYFTVPEVVRRLKGHVGRTLIVIILAFVALRLILPPLAHMQSPGETLTEGWRVTLELLRIYQLECMAVGGLGALLVHRNDERWLERIYRPSTQIGTWVVILACGSLGIRFGPIDNTIWAGLFTIMILNLGTNPKTLLKLENPWLDYLGKITFGLYLYHTFFIVLAMNVLEDRLTEGGLLYNLLLYGGVFSLTFLTSAASYRYLERPVLLMKRKFMVVESQVGSHSGK